MQNRHSLRDWRTEVEKSDEMLGESHVSADVILTL
jgi:hypothetical protein